MHRNPSILQFLAVLELQQDTPHLKTGTHITQLQRTGRKTLLTSIIFTVVNSFLDTTHNSYDLLPGQDPQITRRDLAASFRLSDLNYEETNS